MLLLFCSKGSLRVAQSGVKPRRAGPCKLTPAQGQKHVVPCDPKMGRPAFDRLAKSITQVSWPDHQDREQVLRSDFKEATSVSSAATQTVVALLPDVSQHSRPHVISALRTLRWREPETGTVWQSDNQPASLCMDVLHSTMADPAAHARSDYLSTSGLFVHGPRRAGWMRRQRRLGSPPLQAWGCRCGGSRRRTRVGILRSVRCRRPGLFCRGSCRCGS